MRFSFNRKEILQQNRIYFLIFIFAIATTIVLVLPRQKALAGSETISCNGGGSRTISVGTYTDSDGSQFSDGADLTLNTGTGGSCTFTLNLLGTDPAINLSSLTIGNGVTLTHDGALLDGTYYKIDLNITGDVTIDTGGSIDVTGKGLSHSNLTFYGYNFSLDGTYINEGSSSSQGGSHGGRGGKDGFGLVASTNDSISHPTLPGGSGGGFGDTRGGGVVHIVAATASINGNIAADGRNTNFTGNGAGGTIYLNIAGAVTGTGTLSANGGGGGGVYGAGGGGRIAAYYTTIDGTITFEAHGGNSGYAGEDGSAGTIYKKPASQNYGDLSLDNDLSTSPSFPTELPSSYIYPADKVALYGGAYVFHSLSLSNYATLDISYLLDPNGTGVSDSQRKLYFDDISSCSADYNDTSNANGQIQYNIGYLTDVSTYQSNYVCVVPEYIINVTTASSTAKESVAAGSFGVSLPGASPDDITVDYAIKAASTTATGGGVDYTLAAGTLMIAAGDTTNTVDFTISEDTELEPDEVFVVELSNPSFGILGQKYFTYTIDDNDTPGVTIDDGGGISISEGSPTYDTYTLVLDAQPTAAVTIHLTGDDDVTTTVSSVEFTVDDWDVPQTITVVPIDDAIAQSTHTGTISHTVTSEDASYNGLTVSSVVASISDNDFAGVTVTASGGSTRVTENGVTDTYTLALNTRPIADVTISITSGDEATVSPSSVVFTPSVWNVPQTITITAVDDADSDRFDNANISHSAVSDDPDYNGVFIGNIFATVVDNENPSVSVLATGGSTAIREGSTTDTFFVNLEKAPVSNVVVSMTDTADLTASPSELTFTPENWLTPQEVTLTAVDDVTFEGSEFASVSFTVDSTDMDYMGMSVGSLNLNIYDNDGFTVTESDGSTDITEGGATDSYTVVLDEDPFSAVTVNLSTSTQYTLSTTTLYFTSSNWSTPQTVTVTAVDDDVVEAPMAVNITSTLTTMAWKYSNTIPGPVTVNITDNDVPSAGVTISQSGGTTLLTEGGATDSYTIVLDAEPTNDVTVHLSSDAQSTLSASSLIFTALNWDTPQIVTVTAVNDDIDEGAHSSTLSHTVTSADLDYDGIVVDSVVATITDNDTAGFTVGAISGHTTEVGGTATFTVTLNSEPTADVTVPVSSSDVTEGTVSPSSLVFTSLNWDTPHTVTITGVNDFLIDGNIDYTIVLGSAVSEDDNYDGVNPNDVSVTNNDNDTAGVTVSAISGSTSEAGGSATFTVVLNTIPTADVLFSITSSDMTEGTALPGTLTFTSLNWNVPQTVTVTGVDDADVDGTIAYTVLVGAADSLDDDYDLLNPDDVSVSNTDNDVVVRSSGGGGGSLNVSPTTIIPFSEPQTRIEAVQLENDSPVVVRIGSVVHRLTRVSATPARATIIIESDPITLTLNKGETKKLDTNKDNIDDLKVTYLGFISNTPQFSFEDLTNGKLLEGKKPFIINNDAKITNKRAVVLTADVEKVTEMVISNNSDFEGSVYQPYQRLTSWELPSDAGEHTVYARFRNKAGVIAQTSDTIIYDPQAAETTPGTPCVQKGKALKTVNSPTIYLIDEVHSPDGSIISGVCGKRAFVGPTVYFSYFASWSDYTLVSQAELDAIPFDQYTQIPYGPRFSPTAGTLIKAFTDSKVYVIFAGQKHWVENEIVFRAAGYMFEWVKEVVNSVFDKISTGESINNASQIPVEIKNINPPVTNTGVDISVIAPSTPFTQFLSLGSSGQEVKSLQEVLKKTGYFSHDVTGYFGPVTVEAVKQFQKDHGIDQKGYVGPGTREILNKM